jgi:alkanesulfonate monooxygenase SsuD/methylene tetrahydromethanopterin reductase-like flavin-dependent oxidoreductase (luciferase family)
MWLSGQIGTETEARSVKLGIGLPTWLGNLLPASEMLDWARVAEDAGFEAVQVHDKPNHDTWDPLAVLAAVAVVTTRIRLVTGALLLPMRDEALVAKQAAVVDRLSGGRLDLGVSVGGHADDFELFGRTMAGRGRRFEEQLARLRALWKRAVETETTGKAMGPAPAQRPHPRLWVGGYQPATIHRAVTFGDGYLLGAPGVEVIAAKVPAIREAAHEAGRTTFPIAGLAYVLPSEDPATLADGEALLKRYYGDPLHKPFDRLVHFGSRERVVEAVRRYEAAGLDVLHLIPVMRSRDGIETLARDVKPALDQLAGSVGR